MPLAGHTTHHRHRSLAGALGLLWQQARTSRHPALRFWSGRLPSDFACPSSHGFQVGGWVGGLFCLTLSYSLLSKAVLEGTVSSLASSPEELGTSVFQASGTWSLQPKPHLQARLSPQRGASFHHHIPQLRPCFPRCWQIWVRLLQPICTSWLIPGGEPGTPPPWSLPTCLSPGSSSSVSKEKKKDQIQKGETLCELWQML